VLPEQLPVDFAADIEYRVDCSGRDALTCALLLHLLLKPTERVTLSVGE
jgi:hypothetical protein